MRLRGEGVAPRHARIEEQADGHEITALDAAHPLRINGTEATRHRLRRGDLIRIGEFEMAYEPAYSAHAALPEGEDDRRRGGGLTFALVALFLLFQSFLLYYLSQLFFETRSPYIPQANESPRGP